MYSKSEVIGLSDFISSVTNKYSSTKVSLTKTSKNSNEKTKETNEDVFVPRGTNVAVTYNKNVASKIATNESIDENKGAKSVESLIQEQEERKLSLLDMVRNAIEKQAKHATKGDTVININLSIMLGSTQTTSLEDDDVWGVQAVADRIMAMAESFVGTNSALFGTIKQAVLDGYADAEKKWGGELPQICQDTLKELNSRFDSWEKELFNLETE